MATITNAEVCPDPVRIDGESFYPRVMPNGKTFYYIRQSNIPGMLRKIALEHWYGKTERDGILGRLTAFVNAESQGDGAVAAGKFLAELKAIGSLSLYGYQKRDGAADIGTNAHDWLHAKLTGGKEPVLLPGVAEAVEPATEWLQTHQVEALAVERVVFDDDSGVAGRIDLAARADGTVAICDWKTGKCYDEKAKELYLEVRLQNHLYRRGWSCQNGNGSRSKGGWILKLPRDPGEKFAAYPVPWDQNVMDAYDHLVRAWKSMRQAANLFAGGYR